MKPYTIIRAKDHAEWLKAREGGIGSSEVSTILGLNPFQTPYQLWRYKVGLDVPIENETFIMKAGHYLEDAVSRFYADETNVHIIKSSADEFVVVDNKQPYLRVSPDRFGYLPDRPHSDDNKLIIECKTTQLPIDEDDPPKHWIVQLMYQLGVCRLNQGALAWLTQGRSFGYRNIDYDEELYAFIAETIERFYVDNILGKKEPDLLNVEDVLLKYPRHEDGKVVEATIDAYENYKKLKTINAQIKALSSEKKELEDALKMEIGDAESIFAPAGTDDALKTLVTFKAAKESLVFNESAFEAEHPELYKQYLIAKAGSRRFNIK